MPYPLAHNAYRHRAAHALDATFPYDDRGPRTFRARREVAAWLDLDNGTIPAHVRPAVAWLERLALIAATAPRPVDSYMGARS